MNSEPNAARQQLVDRARAEWIERLIDRSRRNNLLYFRPLKTGTLELRDVDSTVFDELLAGEAVDLGQLLPAADPVQTAAKALEIRRRAQANLEDKGIETLYLAYGIASWPAADGGRPPEAAVLLLPVAIEAQGREGRKFSLKRSGDAQINMVLLHELAAAHGKVIAADALMDAADTEDTGFDGDAVLQQLRELAGDIDGFETQPRAILGNYSYQKMALVRDLTESASSMTNHDLIAALAKDPSAQAAVRGARTDVSVRELDTIAPEQEFLVLDSDSSQQRVVAGVLRGQDGVIHGPPGTGKSQTIVNVLAEASARGTRVLFVAEKRAALDVVLHRLAEVGLGHLALDLHGAELTRREVMARVNTTLQMVRTPPTSDGVNLHVEFEDRRQRVNQHDARVHSPRKPSGLSIYEMQGQLLALPPEAQSSVRWGTPVLARLDESTSRKIASTVVELGGFEDLIQNRSASPWAPARISDGETATRAQDLAIGLADERWPALWSALDEVTSSSGLRAPYSLDEARELSGVVDQAAVTLSTFRDEVFDEQMLQVAGALEPASRGALSAFWAWCTSGAYRAARTRARRLLQEGVGPEHASAHDIESAAALRDRWRRMSEEGGNPCLVGQGQREALSRSLDAVLGEMEQLAAILGRSDLLQLTIAELDTLIHDLADDRTTAQRLPRLRELEAELTSLGVGDFLTEIKSTARPSHLWPDMFRFAWLSSTLRAVLATEPELAGFNGQAHQQFVEDFMRLDQERLVVAVQRVKRAHAERVIDVMNRFPEQDALVRREAAKQSRHMPLRKLLSEAPELMTALFPCFMASPLAVSQLIGCERRYFDLVLFDEASQVLPEDAIAALLRADHAVVAGDGNQLPPTTFFAAGDGDAGDADEDELSVTAGFQSLLDLMSAIIEPWPLDWHYRSKDERLIAFANRVIYGDRLVTFPSANAESALSHILVASEPADSLTESPSAEVQGVVEFILQHAEQHPEQSLGVITLGIKHAMRIEAELHRVRMTRPDLDDFFAESAQERFFVKNLERVQGDERDVIVLSIGVGNKLDGRVDYRGFGPLNGEQGKRRLNVAITRARRRMAVVSSFSHHDMDPSRSGRDTGTTMLRDYLQYAACGGASLGDGVATAVAENPFESSIASALRSAGIPLIPQWGVSGYRIDLAATHPQRPGQFVLAIECDGASYHSLPTARDRDRLRQQHLEALGWSFHRIWSTDWFTRRDDEIRRAVAAYEAAVARADRGDGPVVGHSVDVASQQTPAFDSPRPRPTCPRFTPKLPIDTYSDALLHSLVVWIKSDEQLRTNDQLVDELVGLLGYQRRGPRIVERLDGIVERSNMSARAAA